MGKTKKQQKSVKQNKLTTFILISFLLALTLILISPIISSSLFSQTIKPKVKTSSSTPTQKTDKKKEATSSSYQPQFSGYQLRVPMLLYHYIGNNPNPKDLARDSISMGPDKFDEQMKYLFDNGYVTITLDTLYPALLKQITLPNKAIILTFDDGYMDFYYNAYPILKKYNLHATVFIPTALMNQGYYLTWAQIKEMASSSLITFGAHSVHHYNLTTLPSDALKNELLEGKKVLQSLLGVPINFMAYPYGSVNNFVIDQTKTAGYLGAVGTWASKIQSEGTIYNMPRERIGGGIDLKSFISLL